MIKPNLNNSTIFFATIVVSFCSIIYELVFSELLRVIFGGTVVRYSITVGLFMFSLGFGAWIYTFIKKNNDLYHIFLVEVYIIITAIFGFIFIVFINGSSSEYMLSENGYYLRLYLSHVPIILVGVFSGLEIPLLTNLLKEKNGFAKILGVDYFGSLLGTICYSLYLYPEYGLFATLSFIAFLNLIISIIFFYYQTKKPMKYILLISVSCLSIFSIINHAELTQKISKFYFSNSIQNRYLSLGANVTDINVTQIKTTKYQNIVLYNMRYKEQAKISSDYCLNLGDHIQMCDSWYKSYHNALVDVPLQFLQNKNNLNVLIMGGGDFIAVDYLKKYNANIDLVDIDKEFLSFSKINPYLISKNNKAFLYPKLNVIVNDAFTFLKNSKKQYDLILFDLPGLLNDKLSYLYSYEMFAMIRSKLKSDGILTMWTYPSIFAKHNLILSQNIKEAGFKYYLYYDALYIQNSRVNRGEEYYLLSNSKHIFNNSTKSKYMQKWAKQYKKLKWYKTQETFVRRHSVFWPNKDIIIKYRVGLDNES